MKELRVPLVTVISSLVKSDVESLAVKVNSIEESLVLLPSVTPLVVLVIEIVSIVESIINALLAPREPAAPGLAKVSVATFRAVSLILPEFKARDEVVS